jgi:hypothetical protein
MRHIRKNWFSLQEFTKKLTLFQECLRYSVVITFVPVKSARLSCSARNVERPMNDGASGALPPVQHARSRCGRKKFGFYPGEAVVIQRMLQLRESGLGYDRIAGILNQEGTPTRTGKPWHGRVVNRILQTELKRNAVAA